MKHRMALSVAYGGGLRVNEVTALKVSDVDSARMLLHRAGQGIQGSLRDALAGAARTVAHLVASGSGCKQLGYLG